MNNGEVLELTIVGIMLFIIGIACGSYFFRGIEIKEVVDVDATLDVYSGILEDVYGFEVSEYSSVPFQNVNIAIDDEDIEILTFSKFVEFVTANGYTTIYKSGRGYANIIDPNRPSISCLWVPYGDAEYFWRL